MKTWKIILIVVLVILAIAVGYYYFSSKPTELSQIEDKAEEIEAVHQQEETKSQEKNTIEKLFSPRQTDEDKKSVKVAFLETQEAPEPTKEALSNLLQSNWVQNAPYYINHSSGMSAKCRSYVRYKNGYYKLISSKPDEHGNKTCYYQTIALK